MELLGLIYWVLILLLTLVVGCFLLYCGFIHYQHMKYDHIPGPPRDSFFFGHSSKILEIIRNDRLVHDLFLEWTEKYGPVIRINTLHEVEILTASPEAVKEILMSSKYKKDWYYDRLFTIFGVRFMGKGLITNRDHEQWYMQRRLMDPAFSKTYLKGLMGTFNEKAEELMEKLAEKADGKCHVGMHGMICKVTLDVISKVAFGMELNSLENDQTPFPQAIATVLKAMAEMRDPFIMYSWKMRGFVKKAQESARFLRKTGRELIERRKKAIRDEEEIPEDILTQILKAADLEGGCDTEGLLDNFVTFFIAGQETTANQLAFTLIELAQHPDILEKAQAEVDEVIGAKRDLEYDDLGKLQYLSQVLKESLRLYPPGPGTARAIEEEAITIEGVTIPPKVSLVFSTYIMGRMAKFFPDPLVFNPERFHPDAPKPYFSYFPFALGPRTCIGQVFAQVSTGCINKL
ncbi:hypothetical protein GDO81_015374 [Engystomops pustulosus]|uniref:Cholesterol 24-hydroxylase n=1 Tax=Engystomops pustulosus TaxID=76066 RepID=A0AAV7AJ32_ENGPU|nr:hypothetical protein GDO81_015374 [Engystomops pustulosus]KAG8561514.1 hypothetical protein GDO81_015374 [Engystomops pustulosus]